jgi:hypothetical protein
LSSRIRYGRLAEKSEVDPIVSGARRLSMRSCRVTAPSESAGRKSGPLPASAGGPITRIGARRSAESEFPLGLIAPINGASEVLVPPCGPQASR